MPRTAGQMMREGRTAAQPEAGATVISPSGPRATDGRSATQPLTGQCSDASSPGFQEELLLICTAPEIWRLALRRAGCRDLAEDALQETFYSVSRVKDPGHVENLRAFFCKALIHEINHQREQLRLIPVEDPETVAGNRQHFPGSNPSHNSVDREAVWLVLAATWFIRFSRKRDELRTMVPERSNDPERYRLVVLAVAEEMLRTAMKGHVSWADCKKALQAGLPTWLNETGCEVETLYQRLSRARQDIQMLLKIIVIREELSP
jgi:DNA-directed RNA polymerase specialized sigma24 family protein